MRVPAGAQVVGIRETLEQRRSLLLAHAHSRGNGGGCLFLVAHARQTFQQRALAGRQIVEPILIEGRYPVEQQVELILNFGDRLVGDQLVEHHDQPRVPARHPVKRLQARTHVRKGCEDIVTAFPFEVAPDYFNGFLKTQALENLNVEEVVKGLSNIGDGVEVQRRGGQQQAAAVGHEELSQRGQFVFVANLPRKYFAQVLEHDEQCAIALAILLADCGRQRVDYPGVVFLGLYLGEQLRP